MNPSARLAQVLTAVLGFALMATPCRVPAQAAAVVGPDTVEFTSGALGLRGLVYRPAGAGPFPTILFNHGSGRNYDEQVVAVGPAIPRATGCSWS